VEFTTYRYASSRRRVRFGWYSRDNVANDFPTFAFGRSFFFNRNCSPGVILKRIHVAFFSLNRSLVRDEGSAVVEFATLAIPLFLPIMIYLGAIHHNATISSDLGSLARQSARAFITSPTEGFEDARMQTVLELFRRKILEPAGISGIPTISIICSASPCLTPDSKVRVQVTLVEPANSFSGIFRFLSRPARVLSATNTQIVDAWR